MVDSPMPLTSHLAELRGRLVKGTIAMGVGMGVAFFFSERIVAWLARVRAIVPCFAG